MNIANNSNLPIFEKKQLPKSGLWAESRVKRPLYGTSGHSHDYHSIIYVVSGRGTVRLEHKKYDLSPNTVIPLEKNRIHEIADQPRKSMTVYSIYFDEVAMDKQVLDSLFHESKPFVLPLHYAEQVKQNLRQILHEQNHTPPACQTGIRLSMELTLLHLYRAKLRQSQQTLLSEDRNSSFRVQSILSYIMENCHEQYTLSDAARIAAVSQRQFTNLCRKISGKSFIQFLNAYRCSRAKELLEKTDLPVSAIAFEVGFEELSSFYRAFRKHQSHCPSEYRT